MKLTRSVQVWGISVIHKHESCFSYIVLSSGSLENAEVLRFPLDADASKWLFLLALYLCWRLSLAIQFHWENWSDYPLLRCSFAESLNFVSVFFFLNSCTHPTPPLYLPLLPMTAHTHSSSLLCFLLQFPLGTGAPLLTENPPNPKPRARPPPLWNIVPRVSRPDSSPPVYYRFGTGFREYKPHPNLSLRGVWLERRVDARVL